MSFDWKKFLDRMVPALVAAILAALGVPVVTQVSGCGGSSPPGLPCPPVPPSPEPDPPQPSKDPVMAIGKLVMPGSGYCSATVVDPPMADGRRWLISAAHCVRQGPGQRVTFTPRSGGGAIPCTVVAVDPRADVVVISTDGPAPSLPWVRVARQTPAVGTEVLHAGYGFDKPGNVERGRVAAGPNQDGQVRYWLSVSNGDSGGGICVTSSGELLSPVCCSAGIARMADVWGGSPERVRQMLNQPTEFMGDMLPIDLPQRAPVIMPNP